VIDPWVRAVRAVEIEGTDVENDNAPKQMAGMNSAAYMLLRNTGNTSDRLLRVESDVAYSVELHISELQNGVMSMRRVNDLEVPAKGEVILEPGGLHIMLINLNQDLVQGEDVQLVLEFEKSGEIGIEAEIRSP
jgi:copper(I)-binding protein